VYSSCFGSCLCCLLNKQKTEINVGRVCLCTSQLHPSHCFARIREGQMFHDASGWVADGISTCVLAMQSERGQKEISAARVREVEVQLASAQNSLKSERLLLQQASLVTSSWPLKTYPSPAPALMCLDANLALTSPVKREPAALPEHPSALATFRMCRLAVSWPHLAATDSQQMHLAKACKRT